MRFLTDLIFPEFNLYTFPSKLISSIAYTDSVTEAENYKVTATSSFKLAVEIFNRPQDEGRVEAVLIHLNHAFEMLLKGSILKNGATIRDEDGEGNTLRFEECVNRCRYGDRDNQDLIVLSESEGAVLLTINHQRDFAEHEQVLINEQQLFLQARQAVNIFAKVLEDVFDDDLSNHIPERILPLATVMPVDIVNVIENEVDQVQELIDTDERAKARQRIRAIESIERGIEDDGETPTQSTVDDLLDDLSQDEELESVFPNVFAALTGDVDAGGGRRLQLGNDDGVPATYIPQEEIDDDTDVHFFTLKNLHDRYALNPVQLRDEVQKEIRWDITRARLRAVLKQIGILDDREYYRPEISLGEGDQSRGGYRPVVVEKAVEAIESGAVDPEEAWEEYGDEVWPG